MKNILRKLFISFIVLATLMFSSCEKVLDLKLDNTAPKIVIEAILTDLDVRQIVSISNTKNFDSDNTVVPVKGAIVTITEENGPVIVFPETSPGTYMSAKYKGKPGKKYTITVISNGTTYTATSVMPQPVPIKSLNQIELTAFGDTRKLVQVNYNDPAGVTNYYFNRVFVNDLKRDRFYLESDRFNDGREVKNTVFFEDPDLVAGDRVKIQMLTIDEQVYKYLFSITQISGNGGPPTTPANPASNFSNGAIGFFTASTFTVDSLVIK